MDRESIKVEQAKLMLKVASNLRELADSVQAVFELVVDSLQSEEQTVQEMPAVKKKTVSLEKVRGVLAEKSRAGFTAQVREIIAGHGASKLSEIPEEEYEEVLKEAEVLGND